MFNRSVNKVVLVGNLGRDPEMRYMPNGNAVANFSLATTESWKNKQTGEYENQTEWHNLTVFGKFAEMCGQYLKKGAKVYVEGKIRTEKWQDKTSGQDRYSTKIIVSELQMLDSRNDNQGARQFQGQQQDSGQQYQGDQNKSFGTPPKQMQQPQMAPEPPAYSNPQQQDAVKPQTQSKAATYTEASMDFDDDIPF
ncbi:MAG: single-stranded DNA-binding protein [Psychromonas sp.]|nr:single-stranded DNA-binding protein [Psychromonas sp.]